MPYTDSLPFSGSIPLSRHCSSEGARHAAPRAGTQARRYLELLYARGETGCTDTEAAALLGLMRSTINARRVPFIGGDQPWVMTSGTRKGQSGVNNSVWVLSTAGLRAVEAMRAADSSRVRTL